MLDQTVGAVVAKKRTKTLVANKILNLEFSMRLPL